MQKARDRCKQDCEDGDVEDLTGFRACKTLNARGPEIWTDLISYETGVS